MAEEGLDKEIDSLAQSSEDGETQSQRETGFRRARGERNLNGLVVQGGRCERLGRVHLSGTDGLESKSCSGSVGVRHDGPGPRETTRCLGPQEDGERGVSAPNENGRAAVQAQGGRHGRLCAQWLKMLLSGVVKMSNPS